VSEVSACLVPAQFQPNVCPATCSQFQELFRASGGWLVPVLLTVSKDTRIIATEADAQLSVEKETNDNLRDTERVMKKAFKYTIDERYSAPLGL
jgi:hypothetical protein